ncbi:MAG: putative PEP-binding protein, partial [Isosphaeraceae bacterium]
LIASALGINRDDPVGTLGDDILHPGLIRMIGDVIASAHRAGRPVSVCGEMAADPEGTIALVALGADSLSLAVDRVASIRQLMSRLDVESLSALGTKLLEARTVDEIRALITAIIRPVKPESVREGRAEVVLHHP